MEYVLDVPNNKFTGWDYAVFALLLAVSSAIGLFYGCTGRKQTTSEFLMAGRSMGVVPVALSLLASFMSAIALLGTPAEIAIFGTQYWIIGIAYCFVMPLSAYIFIPIFYKLGLTSVFEYMELRFSKGVRIYSSIVYIVQMVIYMSFALYAPCLALSVVTGLNKWIAVVSVGVVCTFYTTVGGMKAVMWTDVVQICLMFAGLFGVIIKGSVDHGGITSMWQTMEEGQRVEFFNFDPDPRTVYTFWSLVIGGTFTWLAIYGVNQAQVQRALCTPSCKQGQIALWINGPGLVLLLSVMCLCGVVIYAEYGHCNPIPGRISASDQLLPLYVMDQLYYPGFPGFFTACIFSGALSSISSGLNSLSAVCLQDLVRGLCLPEISEHRATLASKIISIFFGIVMIALTFVADRIGGLLQAALGMFGMIGGPLLGVFILGIIYPWSNSKGAYVGLTLGLVLTLWIGIGGHVYNVKGKCYVGGHIPPKMDMDNCTYKLYEPLNETYLTATTTIMTTTTTTTTDDWNATLTPRSCPEDQPGYLSIYELSYLWYSAFAVFVTTTSGLIVSFLTGYTRPSQVDPRLICPLFDTFMCCLPKSCRQRLRCNIDFTASHVSEDNDEKHVSSAATKCQPTVSDALYGHNHIDASTYF